MDKWYNPKRHSGFSKDKSVDSNIRTMMRNADHRKSEKGRLRQVGRQALALSNITKSVETKEKAKAVYKKAFKRLKK